MPIAATAATLVPAEARPSPSFFSRLMMALMRSRAAQAERIVADLTARRGLELIDGEWVSTTRPTGLHSID